MRYKVFTILLLLTIIGVLVVVFIKTNSPPPPPPKPIVTIPASDKISSNTFEFNMYYTKGCTHSLKALPDFTKLKTWIDNKNNKIGKNNINVHLYDVKNTKYVKTTRDRIKLDIKVIGIDRYPTIVLFNGNTKTIQQYDGKRELNRYKELLTNL